MDQVKPKPPTAAEIARQQASVARAKRNEAGGKTSHADRVKARNDVIQKQNAARAAAHPAEAKRSGDKLFRRTGTGSVADRLTRRDMPQSKPSAQVDRSEHIDPDAIAATNKEPVDHKNIHESKPHPEAQTPPVRASAGGRQYRRVGRGSEGGGRFT